VAVGDSSKTRRFADDDADVRQAVVYIAGLRPAGIVLEATGRLEMSLAAALQVAGPGLAED